MKKSKNYEEVWFKPEVVREASGVFERFLEDKEVSSRFCVTTADETWEYDSEEEFYSAYRKGCRTANYRKDASDYSLHMYIYEKSTEVEVSAPTGSVIAAVFEVFEKHLKESRLPRDEEELEGRAPVSEFELERQITSCLVTKDLLAQLEEYLVRHVSTLTNMAEESARESFSLSITDVFGTERLESVSKYLPSLFPKSTSEIRVDLRLFRPKSLRVSICFSTDKTYSQIRIVYEAEEAREVVMAIADGLKRIIEPNSNSNKVFHISEVFLGVAWVLLPVLAMLSLAALKNAEYSLGFIGSLVFLCMLFYIMIGRFIRPYITYDTQRYAAMKRWSDWIIRGFIGFLIFGTLLTLLRRQIFGF